MSDDGYVNIPNNPAVTISTTTGDSATIAWKEPYHEIPIQNYKVYQYVGVTKPTKLENMTNKAMLSSSIKAYTFSGLTPGNTYWFVVTVTFVIDDETYENGSVQYVVGKTITSGGWFAPFLYIQGEYGQVLQGRTSVIGKISDGTNISTISTVLTGLSAYSDFKPGYGDAYVSDGDIPDDIGTIPTRYMYTVENGIRENPYWVPPEKRPKSVEERLAISEANLEYLSIMTGIEL